MSVVKIGCEAYIVKDNKVLLGKRGNVYGSGSWALAGGHLEFMERADDCLARELKEEMGIDVATDKMTLLALTDDLRPNEGSHYIHITFSVDIGNQEPKLLEPELCEEWKWFPLSDLPTPFFEPHQKILETIKSKGVYKKTAS